MVEFVFYELITSWYVVTMSSGGEMIVISRIYLHAKNPYAKMHLYAKPVCSVGDPVIMYQEDIGRGWSIECGRHWNL